MPVLGPGIFRKHQGRLPLSSRLLLAPMLFGHRLSWLHYRRQCRAWDPVVTGVWIGRQLTEAESQDARAGGDDRPGLDRRVLGDGDVPGAALLLAARARLDRPDAGPIVRSGGFHHRPRRPRTCVRPLQDRLLTQCCGGGRVSAVDATLLDGRRSLKSTAQCAAFHRHSAGSRGRPAAVRRQFHATSPRV